jgi:hypothetical protein
LRALTISASAGAQPQPRQQQQDRVIAPADQPAPIATAQQLLDRDRIETPRERAISQIGDRRDRPHKRRVDQAGQVQVA